MDSSEDLSRALADAGIEAPVRWFDEIGSTNAEAISWAKRGAPEWSTVGAGHQTSGRGRLGRNWQDVPGGALLVSFVLRPAAERGGAGLITLLAGAAMAEAAQEVAGVEARCRWPNDITAGGAKVAGILAESSLGASDGFVVVGVGVNLDAPADVDGAGGLGHEADAPTLLTRFLIGFREGYPGGDQGTQVRTLDRWRAASATLGEEVEARFADGNTVRGRAVDVDDEGGLIIESADGMVTVTTGEVVHLR